MEHDACPPTGPEERLTALNALAHGLIDLLLDPQAKTPAERTERRNEARDKLYDVLEAITAQAHASAAQVEACEAFCHVFTPAAAKGTTPPQAASSETPAVPKDARS